MSFPSTITNVKEQQPFPILTIMVNDAEMETLRVDYLAAGEKKPYLICNIQNPANKTYYVWSGLRWSIISNIKEYSLVLGGDNKPYIKGKDTTYEFLRSINYIGTKKGGIQSNLKLRFTTKGAAIGSFRLFDVTNANIIVEVTNLDATIEEVFQDIVVPIFSENLPENEAVIELQLKTDSMGGGKELWVSNVNLY